MAPTGWDMTAESGLARYLCEIRRFPMLDSHEEQMLARRWREHGDYAAADKLITSHLRLVAKIARGYRGYGLPITDVISEGNVGLVRTVQRFKPDMGFRFATYAVWWIRASIQDYILRSRSLVRMGTTSNQRKLFFNLQKAKRKISVLDEGEMRHGQIETIANQLGVTEQEVVDMSRCLSGDASLNVLDSSESGDWHDQLMDETPNQEATLAASDEFDTLRKTITLALNVLTDRERRIFEARRLAEEPATLGDLACEFGVSRERVRQIDAVSFEKVKKAIKNNWPNQKLSLY